ncbi:MAG: 2-C-methyl-D-erythritol 4-phosphate cytidylyltransferase [Thermoleophilia bacterium]|nr:2-C-methyl-D-erythritol 4-phosphate cytidylyltransferase [Thermoleophilia bacterium]
MSFDPDDLIDDVAVVLLAAGVGARLGSARPKAFVGLAGEAMLVHSLRAFEAHEAVDSIVLVVPEDWLGPAEVLVDDIGCDKVSSIEIGGASRAASVRNGLEAVADRRATAVLVHDAARPIVPESLVDRVLSPLADGADAVVPALPVTDTIKRVGSDGTILETIDRSVLCAAQTPQACRASALHAALRDLDDAALAAITDDASAIEAQGGRTVMVVGDQRTRKVTTPDDLEALELVLAPATPEAAAAATPDPALEGDADPDHDLPEDMDPLDEDDLAGAEAEAVALVPEDAEA